MLPHSQAAICSECWHMKLLAWLAWLAGLLMWTAAGLLLRIPQVALKHSCCHHPCLPQQAEWVSKRLEMQLKRHAPVR